MAELSFSMNDLYPNAFGGLDTSTSVNPDTDDQDALNEDRTLAEQTNTKTASGKAILTGIFLIGCLVVFFGANTN